VVYTGGEYPSAVLTADFNGDGNLDLATANRDEWDSAVSVLLGIGDGSFQAARNYEALKYPESIAVGDFNDDGKLDLVTGHSADYPDHSGYISVLLGNGDGGFQLQSIQSTGGSRVWSLAVGDFDADGKLDVAATGSTHYYGVWTDVAVLLGHGDGSFVARSVYGIPGGYAPSLVAGDFNRDGKDDLAWAEGRAVGVRLSNGDGTFATTSQLDSGGHDRLSVADINGDDNPDLVATGTLWREASVLLGNGQGAFQAPQIYAAEYPDFTAVGDFNGDGSLDVLVGDNLLPGSGDDAGTLPAGGGPQTFGDFNGDGRWDIAEVALFGGNAVLVRLNDGSWDGPPDPLPPPLPSLSINDVPVVEGNTGTVAATFTVALSVASTQAITVAYATANNTATAGSDYAAASGTVTIPAGQTSKTFTVAVKGDRLAEPTETYAVNLSSPTNATIADGLAIGTILDNEPRISIGDVSKKEGKKNQSTQFTFTVTLSAAYDQPVTLSYKTANGTATTGAGDYLAKTGTLTFAPGETSKTITIEVKGDGKREANEAFYLDMFALSSNALFNKNRGVGMILNDD
jgi:hypothetical protein